MYSHNKQRNPLLVRTYTPNKRSSPTKYPAEARDVQAQLYPIEIYHHVCTNSPREHTKADGTEEVVYYIAFRSRRQLVNFSRASALPARILTRAARAFLARARVRP